MAMLGGVGRTVSFGALVAATLSFGLGAAIALLFLAARSTDNVGIGALGGVVLASPLLALCLIPAAVARLVHASLHEAPNPAAYIAAWFAAGVLFPPGAALPVLLVPELLGALGSNVLAPALLLAYAALAPLFLPLLITRFVPRRLFVRRSATGAS